MFSNRLHSILKNISGIFATYRKTIAYGLMTVMMSSTMAGCNGQIYAALFEDNNTLLYALLLGGPKVKLTSTPAMNNANVGSYVVSGTCSEVGQTVTANIFDGTDTVTATPTCTASGKSGAFTADAWTPAVSGLSDSLTIRITADHTNLDGKNAKQARATVIKDTMDPTVTITSTAPNPTNTTIPITITFSETVTGFLIGDITVGNGTAGSFSGSGDTYTATITPAADGLVTVDVNAGVAQDRVGNPNESATQLTRTYDTNSLLVNITSAAPDPTNAAIPITITFTRSVGDFDVGDITVGNGNAGSFAGTGTTYTATITPAADGLVTVDVNAGVAQDGLGNPNLAATQLSRTYDSIDPTMDITAPTADSSVNGSQIISFTQNETTTAQVSVNGTNWVSVTSGVTTISSIPQFAGLDQGSFTLYLRGTDAAGNIGTDSITLTKDTQNPTMDITAPTSGSSVNGTQTISFTQNESTTAQVSVDGTNWVSVTSGVTTISSIPQFAGLDQGSFTLYLRGTDTAGNVGTDTITLTKDTQNPTMDITAPTSGSSVNGTQTISFTQNESTTAQVSVDNVNWVSVTSGVTTISSIPEFAGLGQTSFTLYLRGTDAAGNTGNDSISLTKDTVAPTVEITAPTDGATVSGAATITFTNNDTNNPQVSVDGTNWTSATGGMALSDIPQFAGMSDGAFTLYLRDTDTAGNTGTDTVGLTKDTTPLTITTAQTIDSDQNGKIDHYKLTFNKSVDDSTFPGFVSDSSLGTSTTDWLVAGYNNRKFTGATYMPDIDGSDNADDAVIYIKFDEKVSACDSTSQAGCDSGAKPDLTTTSTPGLADLLGNIIAQRDTGTTPAESDGADPIVVKAEGVNNTTANLIFSESVASASAECSGAVACSAIYTITGSPAGLTVTNAVMSGGAGVDGSTVVLTTSAQTDLRSYTATVTLATVTDLAANSVPSGKNTATFAGQPVELHLQSASAASNTSVNLTFNDSVKATTAECSGGGCASIYAIPGLTISAAVMTGGAGVDGTGVTLTTSTHTSNTIDGYTVTVASGVVQNATGTVTCNAPYNTDAFTGDTLPSLSTASSIDATHIDVTYSEGVQWDTAANGALLNTNYCIELASDVTPQLCNNPALGANTTFTISSQVAGTVARITTVSSQVAGTLYRVAVFNVRDTTGNPIKTTADANTQTFTGLENIKVQSASQVVDNSLSFTVFRVTFSKAPKVDGGVNSVNYTGLVNWAFQGLSGVTLCTPGDDVVCPTLTSGDTSVYFKASPEPEPGAYTVIGATAVGSPTGAVGCIQNQDGTAACLQAQPNDRAALIINLPDNIGAGWVYNDPFGDNVTYSGQVVKYNQKLLIGPNAVDSGLYQVDYNLGSPVNITLDSDNITTGQQPFRGNATPNNPPSNGTWESCSTGTWPSCTAGNYLSGIDYFYAGCFTTGSPWIDSTLTGQDCTDAGGTEYLMILGYDTTVGSGASNGYQSNWTSTSTTTPFTFSHLMGLSNYGSRTFRAMNVVMYKGWVYQASQHQAGSMAVRWNRFKPNPGSACPGGGNTSDTGAVNGTNDCYRMTGTYLNRMAENGTIRNGQSPESYGLISIDTMYEYDNDGSSGTNYSALYIANGGSCNGCLTSPYPRNTTTYSDGGVLRSRQAYSDSTPPSYDLGSAAGGDLVWEDVTPSAQKWRSYMSIPLPQDARAGYDWDYLEPANTITPSIKAIPKMVSFNGDLYMMRNACSSETVQTLDSTTHRTCPTANVIPQLWRLPQYTGTCTTGNLTGTVSVTNNTNTVTGSGTTFTTSFAVGDTITAGGQTKVIMAIASATSMTTTECWNPAVSGATYRRVTSATDSSTCTSGGYTWTSGTNGANGAVHWELVSENASTGRTDMTGADWPGGSSQSTMCGNNTEITLLVVNGDRLYIGFDNATNGTNIWRTKSGVTRPTADSDFEAVCGTGGTVCAVPSKQFGWNGSNTKIFDGISVNDGGTDYVIITARTGTAPLRIYRTTNN